jgi:hypothetical protein
MKYCYLLLCFAFTSREIEGQTIVNGYYVSTDNDTVHVEVKVPKMIFDRVNYESLERKLKVADSSSESFQKFKPGEIKGFGFSYKNTDYNFTSKSIKGKRPRFFQKVVSGDKASLYFYYTTSVDYTTYLSSRKSYTYIVEKRNGDNLVLRTPVSRRKIKARLKKLFENEPNAQAIIDESAISNRHLKNSLKKIIEAINKP